MSSADIATLSNYASYLQGLPYDNRAFIGKPHNDGTKYVCSTLVSDVSNTIGLGDIQGNPNNMIYDYPTPNDILSNPDYQLIGSSAMPSTLPTPPLVGRNNQ